MGGGGGGGGGGSKHAFVILQSHQKPPYTERRDIGMHLTLEDYTLYFLHNCRVIGGNMGHMDFTYFCDN